MERIGRTRNVRIRNSASILESNWMNMNKQLDNLIETMVEHSVVDLNLINNSYDQEEDDESCGVCLNTAEIMGLKTPLHYNSYYEIFLKSSFLPPRVFCLKFHKKNETNNRRTRKKSSK